MICFSSDMRSLLSLTVLTGLSLSEPEADPTADPALLAAGHHLPGHHSVLAAGHHGYGYEAAGYCANGGQCVPPVRTRI